MYLKLPTLKYRRLRGDMIEVFKISIVLAVDWRSIVKGGRKWVGLKSDGTTGQTTGHLATRGSASRYMARCKATRRATELTTV